MEEEKVPHKRADLAAKVHIFKIAITLEGTNRDGVKVNGGQRE